MGINGGKVEKMHAVLLGDSVFDNASYTGNEPSVTDHLKKLTEAVPQRKVSLLAVDGSVTREARDQLAKIPSTATHLVISSGGNDALSSIDLLTQPAGSVAEALDRFRAPLIGFELDYRRLLEDVTSRRLPSWCCTIYHGDFEPPMDAVIPVAVSLFNDIIYRVAGDYDVPVIELRSVCNDPGDFAYTIEPSGTGGAKIAAAIVAALNKN